MIDDETRAKIRRLHYAEHWRVGTIAAQLGLHHDTVRRALGKRKVVSLRVCPSKLDPYKDFIHKALEEYPRLRATRLYDMVVARGFEGSVTIVRRYARRIRPSGGREAFLRLNTLPGEQAQVDWGQLRPRRGRQRQTDAVVLRNDRGCCPGGKRRSSRT
ncbi:transposase [Pseudenhygromyxa sp. WMMC2535]|uniref:transposase n=1 Tax=Pseudenhygromyxa sp. WMMC2535 TaxID=2712867 RepID=UPI0015566F12|nr:transposase [Pseudenhygromyxa sp. WMMC2535]NVB39821.1 transposase [Pseudenhygromyxa sp. WMMC2535]